VLHRVARQSERCPEVVAGGVEAAVGSVPDAESPMSLRPSSTSFRSTANDPARRAISVYPSGQGFVLRFEGVSSGACVIRHRHGRSSPPTYRRCARCRAGAAPPTARRARPGWGEDPTGIWCLANVADRVARLCRLSWPRIRKRTSWARRKVSSTISHTLRSCWGIQPTAGRMPWVEIGMHRRIWRAQILKGALDKAPVSLRRGLMATFHHFLGNIAGRVFYGACAAEGRDAIFKHGGAGLSQG
jgi:hypothetical protein